MYRFGQACTGVYMRVKECTGVYSRLQQSAVEYRTVDEGTAV